MIEDTFQHKGKRRKLIEKLREKLEIDDKVLDAMMNVPRHLFFDSVFHRDHAYDDKAFPIGAGQTISQPTTVAIQTHLLDVQKGDKILEIGTGSGYQASVLCEMGAKVFSIERQRSLYKHTKPLLSKLGYKARLFYGDGYMGQPAFAPYDKIIVTCGAPEVPQELLKQLAIEGKMIIPLGAENQEMTEIIKKSESSIETNTHGLFSFVPMLKNKEN